MGAFTSFTRIVSLFALLVGPLVAQRRIPCPLAWKETKHDGSPPEHAIATQGEGELFVSRTSSEDIPIVGLYQVSQGVIEYPSNSQARTLEDLVILTNPNDCIIEWVEEQDFSGDWVDLLVNVSGSYVGKVIVDGTLSAGPVTSDLSGIEAAFKGQYQRSNEGFHMLISYIKGFNVKMLSISYEKDPGDNGMASFLGHDVIKNEADVRVTHGVQFSHEVYSSYSLTESDWCSSSYSLSFGGLWLPGWGKYGVVGGVGAQLSIFGSEYSSKTYSSSKRQNITIYKEVQVEPHEQIEICSSVIVTPEDFATNYAARMQFTTKGWTGHAIAVYLKDTMNWSNVTYDESAAFRDVSGTMNGTLGVNAKIHVSPLGAPDGCTSLKKLENARLQRRFQELKKEISHPQHNFPGGRPDFDLTIPEIADARSIVLKLYTRNSPGGYVLYVNNRTNLDNSPFIRDKPLKIITHGWNSKPNVTLKNKYLEKMGDEVNVLLVDWHLLAAGIHYHFPSANTRLVGRIVATLIENLVMRRFISYDKIHAIGHSLGAHVVGFIGSFLVKGKLGRITALDPAKPLFDQECDGSRIDPSDAHFVDVIHTAGVPDDKIGLAFLSARGHADFYPNGGTPSQPGCPFWEALAPITAACSHNYVWPLVIDALNRGPNAGFEACNDSGCHKLGEYTSSSARGKFYLTTPEYPTSV